MSTSRTISSYYNGALVKTVELQSKPQMDAERSRSATQTERMTLIEASEIHSKTAEDFKNFLHLKNVLRHPNLEGVRLVRQARKVRHLSTFATLSNASKTASFCFNDFRTRSNSSSSTESIESFTESSESTSRDSTIDLDEEFGIHRESSLPRVTSDEGAYLLSKLREKMTATKSDDIEIFEQEEALKTTSSKSVRFENIESLESVEDLKELAPMASRKASMVIAAPQTCCMAQFVEFINERLPLWKIVLLAFIAVVWQYGRVVRFEGEPVERTVRRYTHKACVLLALPECVTESIKPVQTNRLGYLAPKPVRKAPVPVKVMRTHAAKRKVFQRRVLKQIEQSEDELLKFFGFMAGFI